MSPELFRPASEPQGDSELHGIIELSRNFLADHYLRRNFEAAMAHYANDVMWIGPMDCQRASNVETVRSLLAPEYGNAVLMSNEEWDARKISDDSWVVSGSIIAQPADETASHLIVRQRFTMVWVRSERSWKVVHQHVSNSYDFPPRGENVLEAGQDAIGYFIDSMTETTRDEPFEAKLAFVTVSGTNCYLKPSELLCIISKGATSRIVHAGGSFLVRRTLTDLQSELPDAFVRSHRSCIVNATRVAKVHRFQAELDNGTVCPIAEKRYTQVRAEIERAAQR